MKEKFKCMICGNTNLDKTGIKNEIIYCRQCIAFQGNMAPSVAHVALNVPITLEYDLTIEQKRIADEVLINYQNHKNSLIYAVCGAGKTELVYETIRFALSRGHQIGFTVPRREVVIELSIRIKETFPKAKVISVFGGHTEVLTGNIIVLTTHQLYRYPNYFDLLIFDEIDAFPYKGDEVLEVFFQKSIKGSYVLLSATPSQKLLTEFPKTGEILTLFTRFHNSAIPVPTIKRGFTLFNFIILITHLTRFLKIGKPVLVFAPTISTATVLYKLLRLDFKNGNLVHSKIPDNSKIIDDFKKGTYKYLVTTTVLERGVTIKGLQVIIYGADHNIYDSASLIQIAGRVGRKKEEKDGEVIFITTRNKGEIREAINDIKAKNEYLSRLLQGEKGVLN